VREKLQRWGFFFACPLTAVLREAGGRDITVADILVETLGRDRSMKKNLFLIAAMSGARWARSWR
jgi:hypothetical protein